MINSMTAYSSHETISESCSIGVEIKAYNSKHLDVPVRLKPRYGLFEARIKQAASKRLTRGRVEIRLDIKEEAGRSFSYNVDIKAAGTYLDAVMLLKKALNLQGEPDIKMLESAPGVIRPSEGLDLEALWPEVEACVEDALDGLDDMRKREGDFIRNDFDKRLEFITGKLELIEAGTDDLLEIYQQRLIKRIETLTKGAIEIDPDKITQEAAFLADKSDISEEVVRAKSHMAQFNLLMNSDEPAGRKLNFLLQELNREFTTMGNKAQNAGISHMIVDVKAELEKIREQVQNIE